MRLIYDVEDLRIKQMSGRKRVRIPAKEDGKNFLPRGCSSGVESACAAGLEETRWNGRCC